MQVFLRPLAIAIGAVGVPWGSSGALSAYRSRSVTMETTCPSASRRAGEDQRGDADLPLAVTGLVAYAMARGIRSTTCVPPRDSSLSVRTNSTSLTVHRPKPARRNLETSSRNSPVTSPENRTTFACGSRLRATTPKPLALPDREVFCFAELLRCPRRERNVHP